MRIIRGHKEIYESYKKALNRAAEGTHLDVRTVASLPPSPDVASDWDNFLCEFLSRHPEVIYKRAIITRETSE